MRIQVLVFSFLVVIFLPQAKAQNIPFAPNDTVNYNLSFSSIQVFGDLSAKAAGGGLKFCGSTVLNINPRYSIGPSVFLERLIFPKYLEEKNVKEAHITFLSPGVNAKYGLNRFCYLQVDVTLLIGMETRVRIVPKPDGRTDEDPLPLSGLQLEQTIYYKTPGKKGVQLGIGLFERVTDSNIYHFDYGAKVYLGFGW